MLDEPGDLAIDHREDLVGAVTACGGDREAQERGIAEGRELRIDRRGGLLLDHELAVEAGRRAPGEQRRDDLERRPVGVVLAGRLVPDEQAIRRDRLRRAHDALLELHRLGRLGGARELGGRDVRVVLLDQRVELGLVEIADAHDRRVVRRVPGPIELPDLGERERANIFPSSRSWASDRDGP